MIGQDSKLTQQLLAGEVSPPCPKTGRKKVTPASNTHNTYHGGIWLGMENHQVDGTKGRDTGGSRDIADGSGNQVVAVEKCPAMATLKRENWVSFFY